MGQLDGGAAVGEGSLDDILEGDAVELGDGHAFFSFSSLSYRHMPPQYSRLVLFCILAHKKYEWGEVIP